MRVYRSPSKLFVVGVVGIILIVGAADVTFGYWLSVAPDSSNDVLTTRGLAQQRGDLLLGGTMFVVGTALFLGSVAQLVRRKPVLEVSIEGLSLDVGRDDGVVISWGGVGAVNSVVERDAFDGSHREQLVVELISGYLPPDASSGLVSSHGVVSIDAHDWSVSVTEVALAAQGALDYSRRVLAMQNYEPPSIEWLDPDEVAASEQKEEPEEGESPDQETRSNTLAVEDSEESLDETSEEDIE